MKQLPYLQADFLIEDLELQKVFGEEVVGQSIKVNLENQKVWVDLPCTKEPTVFLAKNTKAPNQKLSRPTPEASSKTFWSAGP
jgi:hypothetical protein